MVLSVSFVVFCIACRIFPIFTGQDLGACSRCLRLRVFFVASLVLCIRVFGVREYFFYFFVCSVSFFFLLPCSFFFFFFFFFLRVCPRVCCRACVVPVVSSKIDDVMAWYRMVYSLDGLSMYRAVVLVSLLCPTVL